MSSVDAIIPGKATAEQCRSFDEHVYLRLMTEPKVKGWVRVDPRAFSICAAAQAAGQQLFVKYWGFDPNWGNGAGMFAGVQVALNDFK